MKIIIKGGDNVNKIDIVAIVFSVAVVIFLVFGVTYERYSEKKDWNNGICPNCGKPWMRFDTDSKVEECIDVKIGILVI